jgi:hypothetical protein
MKKPLIYKEEDGTKYKISFSEELQMKNLQEARKQIIWQKRNFYAKVALILVVLTLTVSLIYLVYRLDAVNFFSYLMYR